MVVSSWLEGVFIFFYDADDDDDDNNLLWYKCICFNDKNKNEYYMISLLSSIHLYRSIEEDSGTCWECRSALEATGCNLWNKTKEAVSRTFIVDIDRSVFLSLSISLPAWLRWTWSSYKLSSGLSPLRKRALTSRNFTTPIDEGDGDCVGDDVDVDDDDSRGSDEVVVAVVVAWYLWARMALSVVSFSCSWDCFGIGALKNLGKTPNTTTSFIVGTTFSIFYCFWTESVLLIQIIINHDKL